MRDVQDAVVPQQGRVPRLQQAKGREARRVHPRVVADGGLATTGRRILLRCCSHCEQAERTSPGSWIGPAAADTGKSIGDARRMYPHLGKQGAAGGGGDEARSALQCDQQSPSERLAYQASLQVAPTTTPTMPAAPVEVETGQLMQIDMATPRAGQVESQGNAEAPNPTAGPKNSNWSWRRDCQPREASGTSRGA